LDLNFVASFVSTTITLLPFVCLLDYDDSNTTGPYSFNQDDVPALSRPRFASPSVEDEYNVKFGVSPLVVSAYRSQDKSCPGVACCAFIELLQD